MNKTTVYLKLLLAGIVIVGAVTALSSTTAKTSSASRRLNSRRQVLAQVLIGSSTLLAGIPNLATAASEEVSALTDEERQEILQRLKERRQLMQASRSTSNRQDYLDLSRQRAKLYNTTSKAWSCPPNIPCV